MAKAIKTAVAFAILAALIYFALAWNMPRAPASSTEVRIVAFGKRWLDISGSDFRLFSQSGSELGTYRSEVPSLQWASFSPDGHWVLLGSWINARATLRALDPSEATQDAELLDVRDAAWSPDGSLLAVVRLTGPNKANPAVEIDTFQCVTGSTNCSSNKQELGEGTSVDWSPDGKYLAVVSEGRVITINIDSKRSSAPDADTEAQCQDAKWSPSGRYLAARCYSGIWLFDLTTGQSRRLSTAIALGITWQMDHDELLALMCDKADDLCTSPFPWNEEADRTNAVYSIDIDTGNLHRITPGNFDSYRFFDLWPGRR